MRGRGHGEGSRRGAAAWAVGLLVGYLLVWAGLDAVAAQFQAAPDVSVWYPPSGLDVVLLLLFGVRYAPVLLVSTVLHAALVNPVGLSWVQVLLLAGLTAGGYAGAVAVLRHGVRIDPRLLTQRDVGWFVAVGCGAGPLVVAAGQVLLLVSAGVVRPSVAAVSVVGRWAGAATGVGMLAPPLLVAARRWRGRWVGLPAVPAELPGVRVGRPERVLQLVVTVTTVAVAYALPAGPTLDYTYLIYVPLIWVAVRGGFAPVTVAVLLIDVAAAVVNGGRTAGRGGITMQFGLVTLTLVGLLLGALITQRRVDAERQRQAGLHDTLTGLANRGLFGDRLAQALARADRDPQQVVAVLLVDLDRFKQVNDSLGYLAGDQLLVQVSDRLQGVTRPQDSVARFGGNEFGVLLDGLPEAGEVTKFGQRLLAAVTAPYLVNDSEVMVGASIGSATSHPGSTPAQVLRDADAALHQAKRPGGTRLTAFVPAMQRGAVNSLSLETALRRAVHRDEIDLVFQPVFGLPDRRLVAAEALARWTLPAGEAVPPAQFVALAEDIGLIDVLGDRLLERACTRAAGWPATANISAVQVAVNVSPSQLRHRGYPATVAAALAAANLPADRLILEITERQGMDQEASSRRVLTDLAATGVQLVIDDFGTGYSSLSYLSGLPLTGLKIDKSFVGGLPGQLDSAAIVTAVLALAAELHLDVTAEGVETRQQLQFLIEHGCGRAQGFLLARPAPTFRTGDALI